MIEPKNLLIVRTDSIGDVILSIPLVELIKEHFPECEVSFLVREYTLDLIKDNSLIDNKLILKENNGEINFKENLELIKKYNFDSVIVVYPTFKLALLLFRAKIKNRIGTGYRWYSFLFNHKIFEHRKYGLKHELEYNLNLLQILGIKNQADFNNVKINLPINSESESFINDFISKNKIDIEKPIIIIHPGSGGSAIDLPINKFIELIKLLLEKSDSEILITGNESEKDLCNKLTIDSRIKNLAGKFSLSQLIALIDKSDILIANSTGPLHIAAALGKYVVGFYPKIKACSVKRWGPITNKRFIYEPQIDCNNCNRKQCERLNCMNSIDTNLVFEDIKKIFNLLKKNGKFNEKI